MSIKRSAKRIFGDIISDRLFNDELFPDVDHTSGLLANLCEDYVRENIINSGWEDQRFVNEYDCLCAKLAYNLDTSDYLIEKIKNGEIIIEELPGLSSEKLNPDINRAIREMIEIRKKQKIQKKYTTAYTCPKCKQNKCTSDIQQILNPDEPPTIKIQCENCMYRWSRTG
jgi:DNA-directed RNA polymerase subunit M/transcription elongation factor TFIIS